MQTQVEKRRQNWKGTGKREKMQNEEKRNRKESKKTEKRQQKQKKETRKHRRKEDGKRCTKGAEDSAFALRSFAGACTRESATFSAISPLFTAAVHASDLIMTSRRRRLRATSLQRTRAPRRRFLARRLLKLRRAELKPPPARSRQCRYSPLATIG